MYPYKNKQSPSPVPCFWQGTLRTVHFALKLDRPGLGWLNSKNGLKLKMSNSQQPHIQLWGLQTPVQELISAVGTEHRERSDISSGYVFVLWYVIMLISWHYFAKQCCGSMKIPTAFLPEGRTVLMQSSSRYGLKGTGTVYVLVSQRESKESPPVNWKGRFPFIHIQILTTCKLVPE